MKQNKKHKVKKYNQIQIENLRERERERERKVVKLYSKQSLTELS